MSDITKQHDDSLMADLALVKVGALTTQQVGALHGMSESEIVTQIKADPDLLPAVDARAADLRKSGEAIEHKATAGLHHVVDRLNDVVADPDTSDSSVVRAGELLNKLSGQADKVGVRTRVKEGAGGETFVLNITLAGSNEPITISGEIIEQEGEE